MYIKPLRFLVAVKGERERGGFPVMVALAFLDSLHFVLLLIFSHSVIPAHRATLLNLIWENKRGDIKERRGSKKRDEFSPTTADASR